MQLHLRKMVNLQQNHVKKRNKKQSEKLAKRKLEKIAPRLTIVVVGIDYVDFETLIQFPYSLRLSSPIFDSLKTPFAKILYYMYKLKIIFMCSSIFLTLLTISFTFTTIIITCSYFSNPLKVIQGKMQSQHEHKLLENKQLNTTIWYLFFSDLTLS